MNEKTPNQQPGQRPDLQDWEDAINALLDGELDDQEAESLKAAASDDRALARAIIEAYQLQQALARIPMERAPVSLQRKLADIPHEQRRIQRPFWSQPAFVTALAAVPLLVIAVALLNPQQPANRDPTAAELKKARQELAIAFSYLEKVGRKTGLEIETTVSQEMQQTINQNMIRTIQDQMEFNKERSI
jgi:anti-sigma factor RsiW